MKSTSLPRLPALLLARTTACGWPGAQQFHPECGREGAAGRGELMRNASEQPSSTNRTTLQPAFKACFRSQAKGTVGQPRPSDAPRPLPTGAPRGPVHLPHLELTGHIALVWRTLYMYLFSRGRRKDREVADNPRVALVSPPAPHPRQVHNITLQRLPSLPVFLL